MVAENWVKDIENTAHRIRLRVFEHVLKNNGGYMSQACSSSEIFASLYSKIMRLGPSIAPLKPRKFQGVPSANNPNYFRGGEYNGALLPEYDQFVFSPSHYALVLYATLIEVGRLAEDALDEFNKDGSTVEMIGHEHSPGCDTTTGSLGQGISQAGGFALARKLLGETGRVWVFMSDGEFQEGQVWEAVAAMRHYHLDNVGVYVDVNGQQCDGVMADVMTTEPLAEKLEAFGARVIKVNGHDVKALVEASEYVPDGRPLFVLAYTNPTYCLDLLNERRPILHYLRFKSPEERKRYEDYYNEVKEKMLWRS
ncbi:MAG: transketolase [Anaerolineae bacterium]|nr:MAG: transketolase [Anaerolineae bacterium]